MFHAVIQTYVLTLLTSMFYGGAAEEIPKKEKKKKRVRGKKIVNGNEETEKQSEGLTSAV